MSLTPNPGPPAGWYPDPDMVGTQRYWDGRKWTDHAAPLAPAPMVVTPPHESMTLGYILAVALPLVGLIYGLVKWRVGGAAVVVASVVAWILWTLILIG